MVNLLILPIILIRQIQGTSAIKFIYLLITIFSIVTISCIDIGVMKAKNEKKLDIDF